MKKIASVFAFCFAVHAALAQGVSNPMPYFTYSKGLGFTVPDSSFSLTIRFRVQNRVGMTTIGDQNLSTKEWEMVVRRLRLRLDGFVYSPKIIYAVQFSFSRGDMDWDNTGFPNVIRDAMLFYRPNKHFAIGMGQTKLPGNRQRINSSGDLQFADRSLVNATFNIDRDFGVQLYYDNDIGTTHYSLRWAVSQGEGRNVAKSNEGLMYSARAEVFPFGSFTNGGDYFEADLMREKSPKLAIAGHWAFDDKTNKTGGTIGKTLYAERSFLNYGADLLFKYRGWALSSELIMRECNKPITVSADGKLSSYVYNGYGLNSELSYVFRNNYLLGGRFSKIAPERDTKLLEKETDNYTIVAGKFLKGHRLKIQGDVTYINIIPTPLQNHWQVRLQVELGI